MIAALFSVNAVYAQLRKIPAEVTNNFTEKFPDATNVEWQDQLVDFKVVFDENDKNYRVKFSNNGEWKITERIIKKDFLPTSVVKGFSLSRLFVAIINEYVLFLPQRTGHFFIWNLNDYIATLYISKIFLWTKAVRL